MKKSKAMIDLARRLKGRRRAGIVTSESLSLLISEYIQQVKGETGELNVDFARFSASRGAPFGNQNRLTHGRRTGEMKEFRADIRAHIAESQASITRIYETFGKRRLNARQDHIAHDRVDLRLPART